MPHIHLSMQSFNESRNPRRSNGRHFIRVGQVWLMWQCFTSFAWSHIMQSDFHRQSSRAMIRFLCSGKRLRLFTAQHFTPSLQPENLLSACQVHCNSTRHITFKLTASCLLMNVNKAVSREEMRKRERTGRGGTHNYKSFISSENHKVSSQKGSWAQINFFQSITSTEVLTFICESNTPTVM